MTGKIADLSADDRALLTPEEITAWEENDAAEALDETDDEREAREQLEADQLAEENAAKAKAERVRLEAEAAAAGTETDKTEPKKPAAKVEKTADELAAEVAAAAAAEAEAAAEPAARAPRPLFKAEVPADLAEQRTALDIKEDAAATKFDEGELTTKEFNQQIRAINRDRNALDRIELKAELAAESMQSRNEESWDDVTAAFFDEYPDILKSQGKLAALNQFVMQETKKSMDAGKTAGRGDLDRAYKLYCVDMGIDVPAATEAKPVKGKLSAAPKNVPPTLRNVPASQTADTDDGKFAYLETLTGEAYERALEKLSPADQTAYYAS